MTFRLRPEAEAVIEAIALKTAEGSPAAARVWYDRMIVRCRRLGDIPGIGIARPDIRSDLRMSVAGNHLILYHQIDEGADIVRVLHGARQWQDLL